MPAFAATSVLAHGGQITGDELVIIGLGAILLVGTLVGAGLRERQGRRGPHASVDDD